MRKAKANSSRTQRRRTAAKTVTKGRPGTGATKKRGSSLEARLESEFTQAVTSATSYLENPERLRVLVKEAARKASSLPKETFKESWAYFQTMLRLIRAYYRGDYQEVPVTTLLVIIAAIIYVVNPLDLIPDWVPGLGFLDDAFIVAFAVRRTQRTLDRFMTWETSEP